MKHLIKLLIAFCLFGYGAIIQAQSTIPVTGGNASGAGGTVSYTIGQVVFTTNTGTTGSIAQGIQQPYEISVITGIEQAEDIILVYSVYPNPTSDFLTLKVENYDNGNLSYQLYDIRGILLENKKITDYETIIPMSNFVIGIYFLKVSDAGKEIKIFKIIKN